MQNPGKGTESSTEPIFQYNQLSIVEENKMSSESNPCYFEGYPTKVFSPAGMRPPSYYDVDPIITTAIVIAALAFLVAAGLALWLILKMKKSSTK